MLFDNLREGLFDASEVGDVGGEAGDGILGIFGMKLGYGRLGAGLARAKKNDSGALLKKLLYDGIADTASAASDDSNLILE